MIERGINILLYLIHQNKKLKKAHTKFQNDLLSLKDDEMVIKSVVRTHVHYTQLLHTLNLLRWYGEVKKSYN